MLRSIAGKVTTLLTSVQHQVDLEDPVFRSRVLQAIVEATAGGATTLTAVCRRCRGAFPPLVDHLIRTSLEGSQIPHRAWLDEDPGTYDSGLPAMPEPHPVDYEWRYAAVTADALSECLSEEGRSIACFGTPTVFWRLRQKGVNATLVDRNSGLARYLRAQDRPYLYVKDLLKFHELGGPATGDISPLFDTVLLDPPWYVDHTISWIRTALKVLKPGGQIVLTLFPDLIRPAAAQEREHLLSALRGLGEVKPLSFSALYTTPLFEHETLSAFQLGDLGQWRSGDLVSVSIANPTRALPGNPPVEEAWTKVQLGTQVIAVREPSAGFNRTGSLRFEAAETGGSFLLKSVSARDPVRKNVTVWTSRNRALVATEGGDEILPFLENLAAGKAPYAALKEAPRGSREALELLLALVGW